MTMHWGCSSSAVTFSANFVMTVNLFVSDTKAKVYTIQDPGIFPSHCQVVKYEIINEIKNGTPTAGAIKFEDSTTCP